MTASGASSAAGAGSAPSLALVAETGAQTVAIDGREPRALDHAGRVLRLEQGYVDLFAVRMVRERVEGGRLHLFRVEGGGVLPAFADHVVGQGAAEGAADSARLRVLAVGGPGAQARAVPCGQWRDADAVEAWIGQLSRAIAGPQPDWDVLEALETGSEEVAASERRRGPARSVSWVCVEAGQISLMGQEPAYRPDDPPIPLTAGLWAQAGADGCTLASRTTPPGEALWAALARFHACAGACLSERLAEVEAREERHLGARAAQDAAQAADLFGRLSAIIVRQPERSAISGLPADPLLAACQVVADTMDVTLSRLSRRTSGLSTFDEVVAIAGASRLRVRRILLRDAWWTNDIGPALAWHGPERTPVALLRTRRRTVMVDPVSGARRPVDRKLAAEIAAEAVTFYPTLPARALTLADLVRFALRHSRGNGLRILVPVVLMGLLTMVSPLITQVLVDSAIPRSELDQVAVCAVALAITAIAMAGVQAVEGLATLRLEGLIDWKLQAAMTDRMLRLPASVFRDYTVGDFVDRTMGIDAIRRALTGRTLRSLTAGIFAWFSIAVMVVYDPQLAVIAVALAGGRALYIAAASLWRLHHENRSFNLQGKVGGFVLQLLAGIGKIRVADARIRALGVWSRLFARQKRHFLASQRIENGLSVLEATYPTLATLVIFAAATSSGGDLTKNLGAFLAFFAAFGQTMGAIGSWASGISGALVAIPHVTRMRPLLDTPAEISDDRKPPGELGGGLELSRVTFRYLAGGPPVLDNVSLRIAPGEYVAIVGPSGSGKSSLFRLLLGFERPGSGAVFYDGKSLDTLDTSAVRRQLGVVLQHGRLATGSLYENICGGLQLPLSQAWEAARMAGLEPDIKAMPMGMHTLVAEGINTLSGGQRQRVMIARAIARRPRILLFDEATSALDNRSQAIVGRSLGSLNVTRLVIAHRLSTVREADRIVVLNEGRIVQVGSFAELSQASGLFADFTQRQLL